LKTFIFVVREITDFVVKLKRLISKH